MLDHYKMNPILAISDDRYGSKNCPFRAHRNMCLTISKVMNHKICYLYICDMSGHRYKCTIFYVLPIDQSARLHLHYLTRRTSTYALFLLRIL